MLQVCSFYGFSFFKSDQMPNAGCRVHVAVFTVVILSVNIA
jgi:hypothetical protein